jgi:hypothetical protein
MSGQSLKAAGVRTSGWLIPALVLCAALSQPGAASPRAAPAGILGAGLVLAQGFKGVMT